MPNQIISKKTASLLSVGKLYYTKIRHYTTRDQNDVEYDHYEYIFVNRDIPLSFGAAENDSEYNLLVVDQLDELDQEHYPNQVGLKCHYLESNNTKDWLLVFESCRSRSWDSNDKFYFADLIWFLNNKPLSYNVLKESIEKLNNRTYINILTNTFKGIGRCLSYNKQLILQRVCECFNAAYNIYMPKEISVLSAYISKNNTADLNLFEFIDNLFALPTLFFYNKQVDSPFVELYNWLHSSYELKNYNVLKSLYPFLREEDQLNLIKKYFHSIREEKCHFDPELVQQFKENEFAYFTRYRYCINTPGEPLSLTTELLADSILTLYNSNGTKFQTYNGILDFAMVHSDCSNPSIQFRMNKFLPVCEEGAEYDENFGGFIYYSTLYTICRELLTDDALKVTITNYFDRILERDSFPACRFDNNMQILPENLSKCLHPFKSKENFECLGVTYLNYPDKWIVKKEKKSHINFLLKEELDNENDAVICLQDVDLVKFKNYIFELPYHFNEIGDNKFYIYCYQKQNTLERYVIDDYAKIIGYRIYPRKDVAIGKEYDVFHFWPRHHVKLQRFEFQNIKQQYQEALKKETELFLEEESREVYKRTIKSLCDKFGNSFTNISEFNPDSILESDIYLEMGYDDMMFNKIKHQYYYKNHTSNSDKQKYDFFLRQHHPRSLFPVQCAPKYANEHNAAIDLPFFWCRGKECFHNCMYKQKLVNTNSWSDYSLIHIAEILGFNLLNEVEAGYEPVPIVREYIAIANRVMKTFKRLKCKECGHLLFAARNREGFNRINFYNCLNNACSQNTVLVYLNYCFKCKKGLIDSRDTAKCPNGWYICPTCLSCCDNALINRQIQRYVIDNRPVPQKWRDMEGRGHGDEGIKFCPECGSSLEDVHQEDRDFLWCPTCQKKIGEDEDTELQ